MDKLSKNLIWYDFVELYEPTNFPPLNPPIELMWINQYPVIFI